MNRTVLLLLFLACHALGSAQEVHERRLSATLPEDDTTQFIFESTLYYTGSSTSVDNHYRYILEDLADLLEMHPTWTLHIRGHVCCGPSEKISTKRAKGVYDYLHALGVPDDRMDYAGYSDRMPVAFPENNEDDENRNRRVDFVIHR